MKKKYLEPLVDVAQITLHSTICESPVPDNGENNGGVVPVAAPRRLYM